MTRPDRAVLAAVLAGTSHEEKRRPILVAPVSRQGLDFRLRTVGSFRARFALVFQIIGTSSMNPFFQNTFGIEILVPVQTRLAIELQGSVHSRAL